MFTTSAVEVPVNSWTEPLPTLVEAQSIAAECRAKRMPLRAWPVPVLRALWSAGQPALASKLERRESPAIEKPIEAMTLDELIETQRMEPLSESRRSFLQNGVGILSLEQELSKDGEPEPISLADAVSGEYLIPIDQDAHMISADERIAARSHFVPFDQLDLVTQRQIEWEQQQAQSGNTHITRLVRTATGGVGLERVSRWTTATTLREIASRKLADLRKTYGADALKDWDTLQSRVDLLEEGARENAITHDPFEARQFERWSVRQTVRPPWSPERLDHSAFEPTAEALLIPRRGRYYLLRDLTARQAHRLARAGAEPVIVVLGTRHRSARFSEYYLDRGKRPLIDETWHHEARDPNELDVTRIDGALPRLIRPNTAA